MLHNNIVIFLKSISFIYKEQSSGWVQILCPFCDDATRKSGRIDHGHYHFSDLTNYAHCFRCDHRNSLSRDLISLGFNDAESLFTLTKSNTNNFQYYSNKLSKNKGQLADIHKYLANYYEEFKQQYPDKFNEFLSYIYSRCLGIDPIKFLIKPTIQDNYLLAGFYNINGQEVTNRYITYHKSRRYLIPANKAKPYYFFQDLYQISEFSQINICEGAFDLINLHEYSDLNGFFIAIGGKQFPKILKELITAYLLIGTYTINIILDNDKGINLYKLKTPCKAIVAQLNPYIRLRFYMPMLSKDVSELVNLEEI